MEEKKNRTIEEIHKEYTQLCAKAGHLGYQIDALTKDQVLVHEQLRELNFEAAALNAKQQAEKEQANASEVPVVPSMIAGDQ